jgi:hypothetical protein
MSMQSLDTRMNPDPSCGMPKDDRSPCDQRQRTARDACDGDSRNHREQEQT